jgi:hypothetical protein
MVANWREKMVRSLALTRWKGAMISICARLSFFSLISRTMRPLLRSAALISALLPPSSTPIA